MHAIWIEVPVADLDRARTFYKAVFDLGHTEELALDGRRVIVIDGQPNVSLNQTDGFVPSSDGSLPYFHVEDLAAAVAAATASGGRVVEPATERPGLGMFVLLIDSEGNGLYLHGAA